MLPFFNIGPFAIPAKPFVIILGIYAALWLIERAIDELELEPEWLRATAFNAIGIGLVGGRLVFALTHWEATIANPFSVIWPITIGYSLWGSILSGLLFFLYATAKRNVNLLQLLDSISPSLLVLIGAWTIGDFLGGPGFGTPANLPLFTRHPVQLYELCVVILAFAGWSLSRPQKTFDGWLFLITTALLAAGMLLAFRFRGDSITVFAGWRLNQIIAFITLIFALSSLTLWSPKGSQESLTSS
ncbi:MAG: prolipoprotein diacylglyceryl transferase [Anaerolineae bacterium]